MSMSNITVLAGLIGAGIQASRTPALHEHEGDAQGMRYLYRLIDLDALKLDSGALPDLLKAAERMDFTGLNITFPASRRSSHCWTSCLPRPGASAR